jgi:hypothetical protein
MPDPLTRSNTIVQLSRTDRGDFMTPAMHHRRLK